MILVTNLHGGMNRSCYCKALFISLSFLKKSCFIFCKREYLMKEKEKLSGKVSLEKQSPEKSMMKGDER